MAHALVSHRYSLRRSMRLMLATALMLAVVIIPAASTSAQGPTPYGGTRWAVPGTIQAENYDNGGEGLGYHDTTAGNSGGAYRADSVDIEGSSEGGHNVGWAVAGEWLNYSISVPVAGTYNINVRVASNGGGGTFHLNLNQNNITGALAVPNTGGWQNWTTVSKTGVYLAAGNHLLGLALDSNGATGSVGNFNWIEITGGGPTGPVCFYADINYGGASFCSGAGSFGSVPSGWNDRASSVRVQSGYTAELFADGNLGGTRLTLTGDQPWLGNNNFNDLMSSYRITQGGGDTSFWGDTSNIPPANNVLTLKFLNRTNGKYPDSQVYWSFNGQTYSIAERPTFDMPANSAGRMYFYLGSPNSQYTDFIEFTVGPDVFNGNTTRVDWFGIKLAMRLRAHDGYDQAVGEDYATFAEDRAVTFQKFIDEVPAEFDHLAQIKAPYMIPAPGKMGDTRFLPSGQYANYFTSYAQSVGVNANIFDIMACAGSLANNAQLCAALNRHVAHLPLADQRNPANFYKAGPANYYAKFWHDHSLQKLAYGFPYDDYAEQSSFVSHGDPQWLLVAIGW